MFYSWFGSRTLFLCTRVVLALFFSILISQYIKMHNLLLKTVALVFESTLFDRQIVA